MGFLAMLTLKNRSAAGMVLLCMCDCSPLLGFSISMCFGSWTIFSPVDFLFPFPLPLFWQQLSEHPNTVWKAWKCSSFLWSCCCMRCSSTVPSALVLSSSSVDFGGLVAMYILANWAKDRWWRSAGRLTYLSCMSHCTIH